MTEALAASPGTANRIPEACVDMVPVQGAGWSLATLLAHVSDRSSCLGVGDRRAWLRTATDACAQLMSVREQLTLALAAHQQIVKLSCVASGRQEPLDPTPKVRPGLMHVGAAMRACVDEVLRKWQQSGQRFTRVLTLLPTQLDPGARLPESVAPEVLQSAVANAVRRQGRVLDGMGGLFWRHAQAHRRCCARMLAVALSQERRRSQERTAGVMALPALQALASSLLDEYLNRQALLQAQADCASVQWEIDVLLKPGGPAPGASGIVSCLPPQCTALRAPSSSSFDGV